MNKKTWSEKTFTYRLIEIFSKIIIFFIIILLFIFDFEPLLNIDRYFFYFSQYNTKQNYEYDDNVVIIISDKTYEYFDDVNIPRDVYGKLLNNELKDSEVVSFDIIFVNSSNEISDEYFAESMANHGNVVLAYAESNEDNKAVFPSSKLIEEAEYLGFVNYFTESDGLTYEYPLFLDQSTHIAPSLVYSTLSALGYKVNINNGIAEIFDADDNFVSRVKLNKENMFMRKPFDNNIDRYNVYELSDVYSGKIPKENFDNKTIFIGAAYTGSQDIISTPVENITGLQYIVDSLVSLLTGFNPYAITTFDTVLYLLLLYIIIDLLTSYLPAKYKPLSFVCGNVVNFAIIIVAAVYFDIMITLSYSFLVIISSFIINFIFENINKENLLSIQKLPIDAILKLNNIKTSDDYNFENYLYSLEKDILENIGIKVKQVYLYPNEELYKRCLYNVDTNTEVIFKHKYIFIPLSGKNDLGNTYCVLEYTGKIKNEIKQYIAALILSADIYFEFAIEKVKTERLFNNIIESMISAVDAKDSITSGHSKRVAKISERIGKLLNLSKNEIDKLHFAAIIHDIGKLGIEDKVLNKPSFFSEEDYNLIKEHPQKGYDILNNIDLDEDLLAGVLYHHERIDGKGYPCGKAGEEIPLTAQIIKIADVYDALVSERKYKKPWTTDEVCNLFYEGRGTEFNKEIVELFIDDIKNENWVKPTGKLEIRKVFTEKTKEVGLRFYNIYINSVRDKLDDCPMEDDFKFDLSNGFLGLNFGNHISEKNWFYNKPICIDVDKEKEELVYYKQGAVTNRKFMFIFLRCYLVAGVVASSIDEVEKIEYIDRLNNDLGEPFYSEDGITVWEKYNYYMINYSIKKNMEYVTVYINKYLL